MHTRRALYPTQIDGRIAQVDAGQLRIGRGVDTYGGAMQGGRQMRNAGIDTDDGVSASQ
jgi:hypothetical protein